MNKNIKKVKLNDGDKKTILKNLNICTDSHGEGCSSSDKSETKQVK